MLRLSISCLLIGVFAIALSALQVIELSFETGRLIFLTFLALAVFSFLGKLIFERTS